MADAQIVINANTRNAERAIGNLNRALGRIDVNAKRSTAALRRIEAAGNQVRGALYAAGVALAGFATQRAVSGILDATMKMEQFRSQLTTYLGSQQLANAELDRLSKLARTLPQDIDQVTEAFVIFTRFGLDTSNESLKAFSNIAAANSKSITQLGEAVADALTGEFERLKEFGIKVSKENGQFTARIGEDQVAVANTTKELVNQLKALGEEGGRFGNVVLPPLTTAMSNFRGAVFEAAAAIGEGGLSLAVSDAINGITELLTTNDEAITAIGDGLTKAFLYAKEAMILVYNNIELIAKGFAILMGITISRWVLGVAAAFAGPLVKGLTIVGRVLRATALIAMRHPLIAGAVVIAGGIEYLTGAFSGLAESLGLIGDDSVLGNLANDASALGDEIAGMVAGLNPMTGISERVNEQFASIKERSGEINEALDEQEATNERIRAQKEAEANLENSKLEAYRNYIDQQQIELDNLGKTQVQQQMFNIEKELQLKHGIEINDEQREEIRGLVTKIQYQQRFNSLLQSATDELLATTEAMTNMRLDAVDEAQQRARDNLKELLDAGLISYQTYQNSLTQIAENGIIQRYELERKIQQELDDLYMKGVEMRLRANRSGIAQSLSAEDKAFLQRKGQEERQEQIIRDRIEFEKKSNAEKAQFAIEQGITVFEALGKENKKAFELAKAFNIAQAIMNTYMGATKALATYPPPFNFIAAAAVVASGLAQVAQIRSQTYSGRQLGGPVMSGQSYVVGENGPELFTPTTNGSITPNRDIGGEPVTVNFNIQAVDAEGFDDLLLQRRGLITTIINDAVSDRGQRSTI